MKYLLSITLLCVHATTFSMHHTNSETKRPKPLTTQERYKKGYRLMIQGNQLGTETPKMPNLITLTELFSAHLQSNDQTLNFIQRSGLLTIFAHQKLTKNQLNQKIEFVVKNFKLSGLGRRITDIDTQKILALLLQARKSNKIKSTLGLPPTIPKLKI